MPITEVLKKGQIKRKVDDSTVQILHPETDADIVKYDHTSSGLTATTVQDAIDEIVSAGSGVELVNYGETGHTSASNADRIEQTTNSKQINITTVDTNQSISGEKTFTKTITLNGGSYNTTPGVRFSTSSAGTGLLYEEGTALKFQHTGGSADYTITFPTNGGTIATTDYVVANGSGTVSTALNKLEVNGTTYSVGDVKGPSGATANHVALYSDGSGKVIKDSTLTVSSSNNKTTISAGAGATSIVLAEVSGNALEFNGWGTKLAIGPYSTGNHPSIYGATTAVASDNPDLGNNSNKWNDIYLSGSLRDGSGSGSHSITIAKIENTDNKVTSISSSSTDTQYPSAKAVWTAIDNLPEPMVFKGSVGDSGTTTWANLPTAAAANEGHTYKVITAHTADTKCPAAKVGDTIISNGSAWVVIPSGDEPSGTVTSVGLSMPTGFTVTGSPVTASGTLTATFASGYELLNSNAAQTIAGAKTFTSGVTINPGTLSVYASGDPMPIVIGNGKITKANGSGKLDVQLGSSGRLLDANGSYGLKMPSTSGWTADKTIATTDDLTGYVQKAGDTMTGDLTFNGGSYSTSPKVRFSTSNGTLSSFYKDGNNFKLEQAGTSAYTLTFPAESGTVLIDADLDDFVKGPSSSTNNRLAVFSGITGKLIADSSKITVTSNGNALYFDSIATVGLGDNSSLKLSAQGGQITVYPRTTSAVDLLPGATSTASDTATGSDLGSSSKKWRNLYLAGNLSDGTNSTTIASIVAGLTTNVKSGKKSDGSTDITGSKSGTIITLGDSGITAGTYSAIQVNAKGIAVAGGQSLGYIAHGGTPNVVNGGWYFEELA